MHYLEVGALTQRVVTDVQVTGWSPLAGVLLCRPFRDGHTELPGLRERLQVMCGYRPELQVRLVSEEPVAGQNRLF